MIRNVLNGTDEDAAQKSAAEHPSSGESPIIQKASYRLTPGEQAYLMSLHHAWIQTKSVLYDLQNTMNEKMQAFNGAVALMASAHGIADGTATPDFSEIIIRSEQK